MKLRSLFVIFVFTAVLFLTSGCSGEDKAAESEPEETYKLDFIIPSINGGSINLEDYRGKVIILDFWAT